MAPLALALLLAPVLAPAPALALGRALDLALAHTIVSATMLPGDQCSREIDAAPGLSAHVPAAVGGLSMLAAILV